MSASVPDQVGRSKALHAPGPCGACDHDPACGYASVVLPPDDETWYCHTDDHSCYEQAATVLAMRGKQHAAILALESAEDAG